MADSFAAMNLAYLAIEPQRFQAIEQGRIYGLRGQYGQQGKEEQLLQCILQSEVSLNYKQDQLLTEKTR